MATPATARRTEPMASTTPTSRAPHRSPTRKRQGTSLTPRAPTPSISPLSAASRSHDDSTMTASHTAMADDVAHAHVEAKDALVGETRDDRSSSLSEVGDVSDDELDANGVDKTIAQLAAAQDENESEAETERLDQTPRHVRKHADSTGKTPSKLSQAATLDEDELSDPPSPTTMRGPGAGSSTSTVATLGNGVTGLKRKRSSTAESSLTSQSSVDGSGGSPRERSNASNDAPVCAEDDVEDAPAEKAVEERDVEEDSPMPASSRATPATSPNKGGKGKKGKQKRKTYKSATEEEEPTRNEEISAEANDELAADTTAKLTDEELAAKKYAMTNFEDLTKQFTAFRDSLFAERLATLNQELDLLQQNNCIHSEYLRQMAAVDARLTKSSSEAHAHKHYALNSLTHNTLGERTGMHGQFFQTVRELREQSQYALGQEWYGLQKERRQQHVQDDDHRLLYAFPTKRSEQLKQQARYNLEVSVLAGVAKHVGFPAAPDMAGATDTMLDADLTAMRLSRRQPAPAPLHHPHHITILYPPRAPLAFPPSEQLAHAQFIEAHAWARPQPPQPPQPVPRDAVSVLHTSDWHSTPGAGRGVMRNLSGQLATTPQPQRKKTKTRLSSLDAPSDDDDDDPPLTQLPPRPEVYALHTPRLRANNGPVTLVSEPPSVAAARRDFSGASTISTAATAQLELSPPADTFSSESLHRFRAQQQQVEDGMMEKRIPAAAAVVSESQALSHGSAAYTPHPAAAAVVSDHSHIGESAGGGRRGFPSTSNSNSNATFAPRAAVSGTPAPAPAPGGAR